MTSRTITVDLDQNTVNKFKNLLDTKSKEFKRLCETKNGWTYHSQVNNIIRYSMSDPGDSNLIYKGIGQIETKLNAKQFVKWLQKAQMDFSLRKKRITPGLMRLDLVNIPLFNSNEDTEKRFYRLERFFYESPSSFVSNREFVVIMMYEFISDDEAYLTMCSVEHEKFPLTQGFVRSEVKLSGWKIVKSETKDNCLDIVLISQVNTGGWVPAAIMNTQAPAQLLIIEKWAEVLKEEEVLRK
jgi:hypothetical protein